MLKTRFFPVFGYTIEYVKICWRYLSHRATSELIWVQGAQRNLKIKKKYIFTIYEACQFKALYLLIGETDLDDQ